MSLFYPQCRAILSVVFDGFGGGDSNPTVIDVFPTVCRVSLNNYKEADTFDMEIDAKALPISPELIRGAGVQIYMFQTDSLDADPQSYASAEKAKLAGLVDKATLKASGDGVTLQLSGRDYTSLMLDKQWNPQDRIKGVGKALDEVVQSLVDEATQSVRTGRTLRVVFNGDSPPPVVGGLQYKKSKKRGFTATGVKNYWDVIYNICVRHGFIVFVQGFNVVISRPNVLQSQARASIPKWVYGRNLEMLEVDRKLGKERVPQIVVRSYDPKTRKAIEGRFPEKTDKVLTGVGTEKEEVKAFAVPGVTDSQTLKKIAENAYNSLARGESSIRFSTPSLVDLSGDFDTLDLRAGDAVGIGFDPYVQDAALANLTPGERRDRMIALGYKPQVASLVAEEYSKLDYFRRPFYVREVTLSFDWKEGLRVDVEAQNFIAVGRDEKRSDQ